MLCVIHFTKYMANEKMNIFPLLKLSAYNKYIYLYIHERNKEIKKKTLFIPNTFYVLNH